MKLIVEGMTCSHCEAAISKAVGRLGGRAQVDLAAGMVVIEGIADATSVRAAIEEEGYRVAGFANEEAPAELGSGKGCCGSCHG